MRHFLFIIVLILSVVSRTQTPEEPLDDSFMKRTVVSAELGYDQFQNGWIYAGIKKFKWDQIRFSSVNGYYGYNPWENLHSLRFQADYAWYFPSIGVSGNLITNGEAYNFCIRPQVGVFFIFANIYIGPNLVFNKNFKDAINLLTFNAAISIPLKRW